MTITNEPYLRAPPTDTIPIRLDLLLLAFSYPELYDWALHAFDLSYLNVLSVRDKMAGPLMAVCKHGSSPRCARLGAYFYRFQSSA